MRPRSWGVLIVVWLLVVALAATAGAHKSTVAVSEDQGHARGGSNDTWEGGDPDGVGLENPDGAFGPPMSPIFQQDEGATSGLLSDEVTALGTLRLLLATVQRFII